MNDHEPLLYQLMGCIYDTPPDFIDQMINQPYQMFLVCAPEQLGVQENSRSRCYPTNAVNSGRSHVDHDAYKISKNITVVFPSHVINSPFR